MSKDLRKTRSRFIFCIFFVFPHIFPFSAYFCIKCHFCPLFANFSEYQPVPAFGLHQLYKLLHEYFGLTAVWRNVSGKNQNEIIYIWHFNNKNWVYFSFSLVLNGVAMLPYFLQNLPHFSRVKSHFLPNLAAYFSKFCRIFLRSLLIRVGVWARVRAWVMARLWG